MKVIDKKRWEMAHVAEMDYWERVVRDPAEFLRILHEKIVFLNEVRSICPQALAARDNGLRVLEVGIGALGLGVASFLEAPGRLELVGVDPIARKNSTHLPKWLQNCFEELSSLPLTYVQMSAEEFDSPENTFDLVFCYNVLDHTADPRKIVRNIYNLLVPGGYLVLGVDIFSLVWKLRQTIFYKKYFDLNHPYKFSAGQLEETLKTNSFKIVWFEKRKFETLKRICSKARRMLIIAQKPT